MVLKLQTLAVQESNPFVCSALLSETSLCCRSSTGESIGGCRKVDKGHQQKPLGVPRGGRGGRPEIEQALYCRQDCFGAHQSTPSIKRRRR